MKKFLSFAAFAICMICTFSMASCSEDEGDNKDVSGQEGGQQGGSESGAGVVASKAALAGSWSVNGRTFTFTEDELTIYDYNGEVIYKGAYTYSDGIVSYTNENQYTSYFKFVSYYNNTVMAVYDIYEVNGEQQIELIGVAVKENASLPETQNIEGTWFAFEGQRSEEQFVWLAMVIKGNTLDLYITPWGQRYTGTYTYKEGKITFTMEKFYRVESYNGNTPLDASWEESNMENSSFSDENPLEIPFILLDGKGYGQIVGRPFIFEKQ